MDMIHKYLGVVHGFHTLLFERASILSVSNHLPISNYKFRKQNSIF